MPSKHVRQQIREAFASVVGNLPTTQARVFTGRASPLDKDDEMPGIVVTASEGQGEQYIVDSFGVVVKGARSLPVVLLGYDSGNDDIEDRLDQIALEIEKAVDADWEAGAASKLRPLCRDLNLVGTTIGIAAATKRVGQIRIAYMVEYRTARGAPQTAIA